MNVTCPSCQTRYAVPEDAVKAGLRLRCARCANEWTLSETPPEDNDAGADVPPPDPFDDMPGDADAGDPLADNVAGDGPLEALGDAANADLAEDDAANWMADLASDEAELAGFGDAMDTGAAGLQDDDAPDDRADHAKLDANALEAARREAVDIETAAAGHKKGGRKADRTSSDRRSGGKGDKRRFFSGAVLAKLCVIGLGIAMFFGGYVYRHHVIRLVPDLAGLYAMVGLDVNLRGLAFHHVRGHQVFENGIPVLVVEGEIRNMQDKTLPVPLIRLALRGGREQELYAWSVKLKVATLAGKERITFKSRLSSPPKMVKDLQVRFMDIPQQTAGL